MVVVVVVVVVTRQQRKTTTYYYHCSLSLSLVTTTTITDISIPVIYIRGERKSAIPLLPLYSFIISTFIITMSIVTNNDIIARKTFTFSLSLSVSTWSLRWPSCVVIIVVVIQRTTNNNAVVVVVPQRPLQLPRIEQGENRSVHTLPLIYDGRFCCCCWYSTFTTINKQMHDKRMHDANKPIFRTNIPDIHYKRQGETLIVVVVVPWQRRQTNILFLQLIFGSIYDLRTITGRESTELFTYSFLLLWSLILYSLVVVVVVVVRRRRQRPRQLPLFIPTNVRKIDRMFE